MKSEGQEWKWEMDPKLDGLARCTNTVSTYLKGDKHTQTHQPKARYNLKAMAKATGPS